MRKKYNYSQIEKTAKNHPVYEDESDSRRKVVIVISSMRPFE